jgi:hypothetical protein
MRRIATAGVLLVLGALGFSGIALAASAGDVLINEIYVNPGEFFDGCEYIELYNTTGSAISLENWVLTSTEYDNLCKEHHQKFPAGASIAAHGYVVIARDDTTADVSSPGFRQVFGFGPDFEMYDAPQYYEKDGPAPNMICMNADTYDDQIRLIPGTSDYAKTCGTTYNQYEALWLYADAAMTNLIDAIEYRNPAYCSSDACAGVGTSDNDAFNQLPGENVSLGRSPSSTDTGNSANDLYLEAATPKAQNTFNNPPDVWTLRSTPCVPFSTDSVEVSVYASDPDGISSVKVYYSVNGGAFGNLVMTASPGDSLYRRKIPPQSDQAMVRFYVTATDANVVPATAVYPGDAPSGAYAYRVGLQLISDVQYVDIGGDSSGYAGTVVNLAGVVTAGRGIYGANTFVIQDGSGPWNGIYIYDATASAPAEEGDSVVVSGWVQEYRRTTTDTLRTTEIYMFSGCYQEVATGRTIPDPVVVTTVTLTPLSTAEAYEAVLVRTEDVTVTDDSLGYGEWQINDGSGACRCDDASGYFYTPSTGDQLDAVQGIMDYGYGNYRLQPRWSEDIIGPPMIFNLVYTPHAPGASNQITVSAKVKGSHPITGVKLFYNITGAATFDSLAMTSPDSIYTAVIGPYALGTTVYYYVRATDNQPMIARKPAAGTYELYVGMKTIYDVQYVVAPADSSPLAGKPVNVAGIVTAATGEYSENYFFIENHYAPGTPAYKGVKVFDRTGTAVVARGDSVTVSGEVAEYYGETEIQMFFPEAITIHSHGNNIPAAYSVTTASIAAGEQWEGVLVSARNATVSNPTAGYGEWLITNGAATDTCRVGDLAPYTYVPSLGDAVHVTGTVMYAYSIYTLQPRNDEDICEPGDAGVKDDIVLPKEVSLAVRPNPMLDGSQIRYALPTSGQADLKVYNVKGELVKTLASGKAEAGEHQAAWDGTNVRGYRVTSGIYFVRLDTKVGSAVTKLVVAK